MCKCSQDAKLELKCAIKPAAKSIWQPSLQVKPGTQICKKASEQASGKLQAYRSCPICLHNLIMYGAGQRGQVLPFWGTRATLMSLAYHATEGPGTRNDQGCSSCPTSGSSVELTSQPRFIRFYQMPDIADFTLFIEKTIYIPFLYIHIYIIGVRSIFCSVYIGCWKLVHLYYNSSQLTGTWQHCFESSFLCILFSLQCLLPFFSFFFL